MLVRDRAIIINDNAIRSTQIARGLNFMDCLAELPVLNAELSLTYFDGFPRWSQMTRTMSGLIAHARINR